MSKIKLAIAEDHPLFRKALAVEVEGFDGIEIIFQASNGKELIEKIEKQKPDVILMDLKMPEMDGMEATTQIKQKYPEIKIIVLTIYDGAWIISNLMVKGANGYLLKNAEPDEISNAIYAVVEKGNHYSDVVSEAMRKRLSAVKELKPAFGYVSNLSKSEREILKLICHGFTTSTIADEMCLSIKTIEGYRTRLYEKFCVKNTVQLIIFALENDLVDLDFRVNNPLRINK